MNLPSNVELVSVETAEHRKLMATTLIKKGALILESEPIAVANVDFLHCAYCVSSEASLRCTRCKTTRYCSRDCQSRDYKGSHKLVCGKQLDPDLEMLVKILNSPGYAEFVGAELMGHPISDVDFVKASAVTGKSVEEVEKLLRIFRCNNFTIADDELFGIAEGAYTLGSLLNHSCTPSRFVYI
jgi:hypothetical protein